MTQHPAAAVGFEQIDTDPTLQLGQPLRQRRRADTDLCGGDCPGRGVGDRNEVLELANREIGERECRHPPQFSSDLLHSVDAPNSIALS